MSLWTSADIAAATGGTASADFAVRHVTFDSREVRSGDLFIALKGEETDGHRYLDKAFAAGAAGALVSEASDHPNVQVVDTMAGLEALARAARARARKAKIIGVTGSVGKTSTKEALAAALARANPRTVHYSVKSYNNHTGVPLSLARMPAASRFGVFEMGMSHAGELSALTAMVRPHIAIVTAIAPAHTAFFADESAIADAKGEIFEGLEPGGTAIIPYDSPHRDRLIAAAQPYAGKIVTFGLDPAADVHAIETMPIAGGGTYITVELAGEREVSITVSQPGAHWVSNALAVIAAVDAAGSDLGLAALALAELRGLPGRGARLTIAVQEDSALVIDESYNANPTSMRAAIAVLAREPGRRVAVLGGMRELGEQSDAFHAALAEPIDEAGISYAILVGEEMAPLARALEGRIEFVHVPDAAAARTRLEAVLTPGDAVLVKGSNGIGLAAVVAALSRELVGAP